MKIPLLSALTLIGTAFSVSAFAQSQTPVNPVAMVNQFEATNGKFDGFCTCSKTRAKPSTRF